MQVIISHTLRDVALVPSAATVTIETLSASKAPQGSCGMEVTAAERVIFDCDFPPEVESPSHYGR